MGKEFTQEGLAQLRAELEYLRDTKQKEIAAALNHAVSFGDLSENAAYHQAKEEQRALQDRILELEHLLKGARVAEKSSDNSICLGSVCTLDCEGDIAKFRIVAPEEASITQNKLSQNSPLGKCLLGRRAGEEFKLKTENNTTSYKILEVE